MNTANDALEIRNTEALVSAMKKDPAAMARAVMRYRDIVVPMITLAGGARISMAVEDCLASDITEIANS